MRIYMSGRIYEFNAVINKTPGDSVHVIIEERM